MTQAREVATCNRCRQSKRKCDKSKPNCTRCERAGAQCTYEEHQMETEPSVHSDQQDYTPATTPPTPSSQRQRIKKRNRVCLSCTRCHSLKVKCDQKQPCARCSRSGVEATCTYTHNAKPFRQPHKQSTDRSRTEVPFALTGEDPEFVVATWYLRRRGSTHFRAILDRVSNARCKSQD